MLQNGMLCNKTQSIVKDRLNRIF